MQGPMPVCQYFLESPNQVILGKICILPNIHALLNLNMTSLQAMSQVAAHINHPAFFFKANCKKETALQKVWR